MRAGGGGVAGGAGEREGHTVTSGIDHGAPRKSWLLLVWLLPALALGWTVYRAPAWQEPRALTVTLEPGRSVVLGREALWAPQADGEHVLLRRETDGGWRLANIALRQAGTLATGPGLRRPTDPGMAADGGRGVRGRRSDLHGVHRRTGPTDAASQRPALGLRRSPTAAGGPATARMRPQWTDVVARTAGGLGPGRADAAAPAAGWWSVLRRPAGFAGCAGGYGDHRPDPTGLRAAAGQRGPAGWSTGDGGGRYVGGRIAVAALHSARGRRPPDHRPHPLSGDSEPIRCWNWRCWPAPSAGRPVRLHRMPRRRCERAGKRWSGCARLLRAICFGR